MASLTYDDLLELLRYRPSGRHPLEILGYECSTRGAHRFRHDRPDVFPQAVRLIRSSLEESGTFPREPGADILAGGVYLEARADGVTALHRDVEVGMGRSTRVRIDFGSMHEAILSLLRLVGDPAYIRGP